MCSVHGERGTLPCLSGCFVLWIKLTDCFFFFFSIKLFSALVNQTGILGIRTDGADSGDSLA